MALQLNDSQLRNLKNDIYGGYNTKTVKGKYRRTGKSSYGYGPSTQEVNYDYYRSGDWQAVANQIGIRNINSKNDISQMFDYVNGYRPPAPAPAPAPAPPVRPPTPTTPTNNYQSQIAALTASIAQQQAICSCRGCCLSKSCC